MGKKSSYLQAYIRFSDGTTRVVWISGDHAPESVEFLQAPGDRHPLLPGEPSVAPEGSLAVVREVKLIAVDGPTIWYAEPAPALAPTGGA